MGDVRMAFKRFKWDRPGYADVMNGGGCQSLVGGIAAEVASKANSMVPEDGYELPAHEVKEFQGKLARGRVVRTKTDAARRASFKDNALKRALDSTGGI